MQISTSDLSDAPNHIRKLALAEGFEAVGFARADLPIAVGKNLTAFLKESREGEMAWLARDPEKRFSPQNLWPEARSIVALGQNYGPDCDPRQSLERKKSGAISVYARGRDYHDVVKKRLKRVARNMAETYGAGVKVFVDTAPVMEKPLSAAAGIGWQGKHTNLVSQEFGSWMFLGIIMTTMDLAPDEPGVDHCGSCTACLEACPTEAFTGPYKIDARRCISYLTIEYKGHIEPEFRSEMGNRIYGCDDCLAACPWNKFASAAAEAKLQAKAQNVDPDLASLAGLDDAAFRAHFSGSPIKRTGRDRFTRNVLIAIGNSGAPELSQQAEALLDDASPLVRAMAVWASAQLLSHDEFAALANERSGKEADPEVAAEWTHGETYLRQQRSAEP